MVTDIVHLGSYSIDRDRLTIHLPRNPEIETAWVFTVSVTQDTITDADGRLWLRDRGREGGDRGAVCR